MGLFSALGFTANDDQKRAEAQMRSAAGEQRGRRRELDENAGATRSRYLELLEGFDPSSYMETAARGVGEELHEGMVDTMSDNSQALNARGFFGSRLNTAQISKDFSNRLSRALAQLSMSAGHMEQNRIGMMGDQGRQDANRADYTRETELDLYAGERDSEQQKRNSRLSGTLDLVKSGVSYATGG